MVSDAKNAGAELGSVLNSFSFLVRNYYYTIIIFFTGNICYYLPNLYFFLEPLAVSHTENGDQRWLQFFFTIFCNESWNMELDSWPIPTL